MRLRRSAFGTAAVLVITLAVGAMSSTSASALPLSTGGYGGRATTTDPATPEPGGADSVLAGSTSTSGTASVGSVLIADSTGWQPDDAVLSYQWFRDDEPIPGATGDRHALSPSDLGHSIRVVVTGTVDGMESASSASEPTPPVAEGRFTVISAPHIEGTPKVGVPLRALTGEFAPDPAMWTYQWYRGTMPLGGATDAEYTPTAADRGVQLMVTITGASDGYTPEAVRSAPTQPVQPGTLTSTSSPAIAGPAIVGSVLTAKPGGWRPAPVATAYQWYRSGTAIPGATRTSYTLTSADYGKRISVKVTASKAGYTRTAKMSASTAAVLKKISASPIPAISGAPRIGAVLTAKPGAWKPSPVTLTYQWYRSGIAIPGATRSTYTVTRSDAGAKLTVRVTGRKSGYASASRTSATTSTVPRLLTSAPTPTISGGRLVGSVLTAKTGAWKPAPVTIRYQWYRSGKAIPGATRATYRLTAADAGKTVTVRVVGSKSGYASATKTSIATTRIGYPSRTTPVSSWACPTWAPIKGNASSMIYHVRGGAYYDRTRPEECFRTERAAQDAGYRRSKR